MLDDTRKRATMRLPRFRIRTLMTATAVIAVVLGVVLELRKESFLAGHRQSLHVIEGTTRMLERVAVNSRRARDRGEPYTPIWTSGPKSWDEQIATTEWIIRWGRERAEYHRQAIENYRHW